MKKFLLSICIVALAMSCNKSDIIPSPEEEGQDCVVALNLVGEISTSETNLTKDGATTSNSIYAVQVYKGSTVFAFGYFDDLSLMKLNLKKGSTYSVSVCMVKDVKNLIDYYSLTNGGLNIHASDGPYEPSSWFNSSAYYQMNRFFYYSNKKIYYYSSASQTSLSEYSSSSSGLFTLSHIKEGKLNNTEYPTCNDWFYGEVSNYSPNGDVGTMDIVLKRTGFKLKYELSGVTDGSVTVKIYNGTRTFINNTTTTETYESGTQFIAFYDTYSAWQYADNYTENMTVAVTWVRGIGITQNLGTKTVQVKRNCLNNIKIKLGSDDRGAGVSLSTEAESSMGTAENDIPVQ